MRSSEIKAKAKELLVGKKMNAALMLLVFIVVAIVIDAVLNSIFPGTTKNLVWGGNTYEYTQSHPVASLITSFASIFLALGMNSYFMKIARGDEPQLTDLFSKGNIVLKAFVSAILASILIFCGTLAFIIPGIIITLGLSMVNYIYIDNPEVGMVEVLKQSWNMMKGHKWQYFCLGFSFIGWFLLLPFTIGILTFWLVPYMGVSTVVFYDSIKE